MDTTAGALRFASTGATTLLAVSDDTEPSDSTDKSAATDSPAVSDVVV